MLRYRVQYAKDPVTLADNVTEINQQATERKVSQWRVVSVFRDESAESERPWCAVLETDRPE